MQLQFWHHMEVSGEPDATATSPVVSDASHFTSGEPDATATSPVVSLTPQPLHQW